MKRIVSKSKCRQYLKRWSPGEIKRREVELGCQSWMLCLAGELFLNSCFSDAVFVPLLCTAVERAISEERSCLALAGSPPP